MTKNELAKEALSHLKGEEFNVYLSAYGGGACGDSWDDNDTLSLSKEELAYLIKELVECDGLFEGIKQCEIDLESTLAQLAMDRAFSDGSDEEDVDNWSVNGQSEEIENYLNAWVYVINSILSGNIAEKSINSWLEYFNNSDNYEYEIEDWYELRETD